LPERGKPDLLIVGQVTIDDVVPASPGAWQRQMGGSSLYAVAGARLWLEPSRIGLLARVGDNYPFDAERILRNAGLRHIALPVFPGEHLVEWLIYEPDGTRRSLPRNRELLQYGAEGSSTMLPYTELLLEIAPSADQVPASWLPAPAMHLCPQVGNRHRESLRMLRHAVRWISVDPSPHYSRSMGVLELAQYLNGATALLPSAQEVGLLLEQLTPEALALALNRAGFAEVVIKRAEQPVVLANEESVWCLPVGDARVIDPTGAGDCFCGAYAACRLLGLSPAEAAHRAALSAAMIIGCSGVEAALELTRPPIAD
jgi:sugar/nucleoside kinase (ribokinase family)